jgi:hypothetical protein
MAIVQISKIQIRSGSDADLPQLDVGEFGWATDLNKLYIGNDPTNSIYPPSTPPAPDVTEVLTQYSTIDTITTGANTVPGTITGAWTLTTGSTLESLTGADLAEYYTSDMKYAAGTVLAFGGAAELTLPSEENYTKIAGVVSTNPAYILNTTLAQDGVCIALIGRAPVQVVGQIQKGDLLLASSTHPGAATVGGIGGISVLDLSTFAWTHKTQTTVGFNNKAVAVGGSVYCGSGEGHSNPANVGIFKLVPSGSDFTFSLDYSFPYGGTLISYALTADASNGIIYLTGGFSSATGLSDNHWRLSTITGEWQQLASLPVALCNTNSYYHNGKVYVVGGLKTARSSAVTNTSSKLYCYTIATNSWATLADLTIPVHDTSLGVVKGKLVAISGSPGTDASPSEAVANVIQHYDFTANTWHVQDKPAPGLRMIAQGGIYDQSLYLWGGSTDIGAANSVNSLLKIS